MKRLARITLALVLPLTMAAACSDGGSGSTTTSGGDETLTKCNALCDAQAKATGCTTPPDTKQCKDLCGAVVGGFNADCKAKASAYYDCGSKAAWKCFGTGGSATQTVDPKACEAELMPYAACFQSTG